MTIGMNILKRFFTGLFIVVATFFMANNCFASELSTLVYTKAQSQEEQVTWLQGELLDVELDLRKVKSEVGEETNISWIYIRIDLEQGTADAFVYEKEGEDKGYLEFRDYYGSLSNVQKVIANIDGNRWKITDYEEDKSIDRAYVVTYKDVGWLSRK